MPLSDLQDATSDTSPEEITAYADQVAKEVAEERKGEAKSDAQITSEHAGTPQPGDPKHNETPAETNSGSEAAEVETDDGDDTGDELEGQEWLTDDVKAEAAAYGFEESEIADFASREELDRALRLFDKSALEAGRRALAESAGEGDQGQARNEKGQFVGKTPEKPAPKTEDRVPDSGKPVEGQYEIKLDKDVYDDEIVGEFTRMRDHYEQQREQYDSRLSELESRLMASEERFADADARAEEQHFDNLVDKLGHADLFGKTDQENEKQLQRRQDLLVAVKAQQIGLEQLGRPTEITESLINRVARMVFSEELGKKDLKQRTRKISKQSNGRQGGGATRPQDPREDPRDEADRLYRELEGR